MDSFLSTSSKQFQDDELRKTKFSHRLWISTTNKWSVEANQVLQHQDPPVSRISLTDLINAPVDWDLLAADTIGAKSRLACHKVKPHQQAALDAARAHYKDHDRGKLIMACGTGKTFTSLRLAEQETGGKGLVLFLVPSISLLGQTLREWSAQAVKPLKAICVCSDEGVSKAKGADDSAASTVDLALPASTNVNSAVYQLREHELDTSKSGLTVVFSTYQSIDVISKAQAKPSYRVEKMRFAKEGKEENKTAIIYNDEVTVWNIPLEAYEYVVNGKSAIEWIMERYQVTTHKESGIVNDPNLWCDEHNQPRYIIDLLKRIVTLSIETMKIVKALPKLGL